MESENTKSTSTQDPRTNDKISGAANSINATHAGEGPGEGPGEKHELGKGPKHMKIKPHDINKPKVNVETKQ